MLKRHLAFSKKMSKNSLGKVPLRTYEYCEDSGTLFVEAITDSAISWADSIIKGAKLDVWGEELRGCKCLTSTESRICKRCRQLQSANIKTLGRRVVGGKAILRTMLAFLMVYKPRMKFHPNFLPSVYITIEGEVRILSLVELSDELNVRDTDGKLNEEVDEVNVTRFSDNLKEVISFLFGITVGLGGKGMESIGGLDYNLELPELPHIPLPLRKYYGFLLTYNPEDPYLPEHFFDPPFIHPWSDCAMYTFYVFYLIDCYDKNIGDGMRSHFPEEGWLDNIVGGVVTKWFVEWSKKDPSKQQNISETYYNLFKHIYDHNAKFKVPSTSVKQKRKRGGNKKKMAGQVSSPKSPEDLVCIVDSTMDITGVLFQAENKYLRQTRDSSKEKLFVDNVRTWNLLGFEY